MLPGLPSSSSAARTHARSASPPAFLLLYRASSRVPGPTCGGHSLLGFRAVRRMRSGGVYPSRGCPPRVSFRAGSLTLRGLLLLRPRGFLSPHKRPSASPSREFLSQTAARLLAHALPPCRSCGFAVLLRLRARAVVGTVKPVPRSRPSWVFPLQGFPRPARGAGSSPSLLPCACLAAEPVARRRCALHFGVCPRGWSRFLSRGAIPS